MTEAFVQNLILPLLRSGLELDAPPVTCTDADLERLRRFGERQMLTPVLLHGLQRQGASAEQTEQLDRAQLKSLYRGLLRQETLDRLAGALDRAGVDYVPLKGAELCRLYPEPWMRTSVDIDLLVHEADLDRAISVIESATALRAGARGYHDVTLAGEVVQLELHFSLKENLPAADPVLSRVWAYTCAREGHRLSLTAEFQIFHVIAHMSYHMLHGGLGVRHFLDLWLLRRKTNYDEAAVRRLCEDAQLLTFYETCCALSEVWLSGAAHTPVTEALEAYCLRGGVFGTPSVAAAASLNRGGKSLLERIFMPRAVMQEIHPAVRQRPWLMPYYQLKRWTHLLRPQKRRAIRSELQNVQRVGADRIAAFEQLLRSVGL